MVVKLYGSNSSTVIGKVEEKLAEINKILPKGIRIVPYYQQKSLVEAAVATVTDALLLGIISVVIFLVIFMGSVRNLPPLCRRGLLSSGLPWRLPSP